MTAIQPVKTLDERISARLHEAIGDLITDEDLKGIVQRGMEKALFEPRVVGSNYGRTDFAPSIVDAQVATLLGEKMKAAVDQWFVDNPDRIQAAITAAIQAGVADALLNTLESRFGQTINYAVQALLAQGKLARGPQG